MHFVHTYITCVASLDLSVFLVAYIPHQLFILRIAGHKPHGNQLLGLLTLENTNTIFHHAPVYCISISQGWV